MAKSSQIIKAILEDIQTFARKVYDSEGLKTYLSDITTDKKLFELGGPPGWVSTVNASFLVVSHSSKGSLKTTYPDIAIAITHKDVPGYLSGDIELQAKRFGNLKEPGVINRLKEQIKSEIESWVANAKLSIDELSQPRRSI